LLISVQKRFVFLSAPKTGSTAVESALAPHCDVVIRHPPSLKHARYRSFMRIYAPLLRDKCNLSRGEYEVVCLFRNPMSWLESWYRYRTREQLQRSKAEKYTGHLTFADFLEAYLQDDPPPFARVGDQFAFVVQNDGTVGVDRIFKYEEMDRFREYLSEKMATKISIPAANVSPRLELNAPKELLDRVRKKMAPAIQYYETL
jgi:hypothetical protein